MCVCVCVCVFVCVCAACACVRVRAGERIPVQLGARALTGHFARAHPPSVGLRARARPCRERCLRRRAGRRPGLPAVGAAHSSARRWSADVSDRQTACSSGAYLAAVIVLAAEEQELAAPARAVAAGQGSERGVHARRGPRAALLACERAARQSCASPAHARIALSPRLSSAFGAHRDHPQRRHPPPLRTGWSARRLARRGWRRGHRRRQPPPPQPRPPPPCPPSSCPFASAVASQRCCHVHSRELVENRWRCKWVYLRCTSGVIDFGGRSRECLDGLAAQVYTWF